MQFRSKFYWIAKPLHRSQEEPDLRQRKLSLHNAMLLGTTEEMWDDTLSWDIGEGHSYIFICDFMRDAVRMKYCGGPVSSLHFSRLVLFICPLDMNALHCLDRLELRITGHFISSPSQKVCVRSSACGGGANLHLFWQSQSHLSVNFPPEV